MARWLAAFWYDVLPSRMTLQVVDMRGKFVGEFNRASFLTQPLSDDRLTKCPSSDAGELLTSSALFLLAGNEKLNVDHEKSVRSRTPNLA